MNTTANAAKHFRILIVDDHPLLREGLRIRISGQPDLEVCCEAEDVDSALEHFKSGKPDLTLVDISLKKGHGLDLVKQIKAVDPDAKMLVISAYEESLYAERALRAGAMGYINKQECRENVVTAIRTVLEGHRYLSPKMNDQMLRMAVGGGEVAPASPVEALTDRELEVYQLIGQAQTTSSIARQLHLSPHTIDSHREKIKAKLGLENGAELTRHALQWVLENK